MLREHMILVGMHMLERAQLGTRSALASAQLYSSHLSPAGVKSAAASIGRELWRMYQVGLMDASALNRKGAKGSVDALAKLYQALQKTKFFDMIREEHFRLNPEERYNA